MLHVLPRVPPGVGVLWGLWGAEPRRCLSSSTWESWGPWHSSCPTGNGGQPHTMFWGSWEAVGDKFSLPHCARRLPQKHMIPQRRVGVGGMRRLPKTHVGSCKHHARPGSSAALGPLTPNGGEAMMAVGLGELRLWLCLGTGSSGCPQVCGPRAGLPTTCLPHAGRA